MEPTPPAVRSSAPVRWLVKRVLTSRGAPPLSVVLWDGHEIVAPGVQPVARVRFLEPRALREFLLTPDPGLGNAYCEGRIEIEGDLLRLLEGAFRAGQTAPARLRTLAYALGFTPANSRAKARRNIHHHYDVGNEFYRLWLDERMQYTCAYFPVPEASLEEAQLAKLDHVCRKLALRPGERVIEAGCGWGGLAIHMAEKYGVRVRAFNISSEQVSYARRLAQQRNVAGRVEFIQDDYRNITGRCDAFVSVGMLEHVGKRSYKTLSRVIDGCLEPSGRGLIHSIGRAKPARMSAWLSQNIFPGAYIPALSEMMPVFEPTGLAVLDVENLRLHYARTLEHWLDRFEKASGQIEAMFDRRFVRVFRIYLASSIASFRTGSCHLYQIVFSRRANNDIPWTRAGVYRRDPGPQRLQERAVRPSRTQATSAPAADD